VEELLERLARALPSGLRAGLLHELEDVGEHRDQLARRIWNPAIGASIASSTSLLARRVTKHHHRAQGLDVAPVRADARRLEHALDLLRLDRPLGAQEANRSTPPDHFTQLHDQVSLPIPSRRPRRQNHPAVETC
jgi:hypothetical protein